MQLLKTCFHSDIDRFLYYADSPLKNYEYTDIFKQANIQIVLGNNQSGYHICSREEPSALYTKYLVIKPAFSFMVGKISYYPRYRSLNPFQRYEFLQVLKNPYQKDIKLGYLFLLLYCLERRLSEGNEEVILVLEKLADYHGGKFKNCVNRTLIRYNALKTGNKTPINCRVYWNYTLYDGCHI